MKVIRGAIATVPNQAEKIGEAALRLVNQTLISNNISAEDITMLLFTCTQDLTAVYPAPAVREAGYSQVPMLCVQEMKVDNYLHGCIRIMVLVQRDIPVVSHVFLDDAKKLRPDWVGE